MRRRILLLISLAGLSVLSGCGNSPGSAQATKVTERQQSVRNAIVVAAHYESSTSVHDLSDESRSVVQPRSQLFPVRMERLPLVFRMPAVRPRFDRLPAIECVTADVLPTIADQVPEQEPVETSVLSTKQPAAEKASKSSLPLLAAMTKVPSGATDWLIAGEALSPVAQQANATIDRGFRLAEKGAYYTARTEFNQALRTVSQAMDAHFGGLLHSDALAAGWVALEEADDFSTHSRRGPSVDVRLIVDSHQTPVLKSYSLTDVSPVVAMQYYFAFAQQQLATACGSAPVASRALHGLGKIHMVLSEKSTSSERLHGPKALAFQQAALAADPANALAANELGVLLARFGKLREARTVLQHAITVSPLPQTWQNLAVIHHRLGEAELASQSKANWQIMRQQNEALSSQAADQKLVQWVAPEAFAGQTALPQSVPPVQSVRPVQSVKPVQSVRPAPRPVAVPKPQIQAKKKGVFWW
jgi:tetratricopeptide (TPR) repeat protein